jgi:hypothetical protein
VEIVATVSLRCERCGLDVARGRSVCGTCGGPVQEDTRDSHPLVELRPEAEPPLPAAHEVLRTRTPPLGAQRKDPTPSGPHRKEPTPLPRGITPMRERDPSSPPSVVAAVADTPTSVPGPMEDPSSWFDKSEMKSARPAAPVATAHDDGLAHENDVASDDDAPPLAPHDEAADATPNHRGIRSQPQLVAATPAIEARWQQPIASPSPTLAVPTLVERRGASRALIVIALCVVVGVLVGWLLSQPEPPTPEERVRTHAAPAP